MQRIDKANDAKVQEPKLFRPFPGMNKNNPMPPKETFSLIPDESFLKQVPSSATSITRRASLRGALDIKLANFPSLSGPTSAISSPTRGSPVTSSISSVDFKTFQSIKLIDDRSKTSSPSGSFASVSSLKALAEESVVGPITTAAPQSGLITGRLSGVSRRLSVREAGRFRSVSADSKNYATPFNSTTHENEEHHDQEDGTTGKIGKVTISGTQSGTEVNRDSSQGPIRISSILKKNRARRATFGAPEDNSAAPTTIKRSNTAKSDKEEEDSVKSRDSIEGSKSSRTGYGDHMHANMQKRTATVLALMGGIDKGSSYSEEFKLSKTQKDTMSELLGLGLYVD